MLRLRPVRVAQLRSLCLNHCVKITDMSFYHLATHCPLIQELHFQGCPQLSAPAVLNLIRTLAYRNGLLRKPAVLALEMAKCAFLTPSVLEEIEKELFVAYKNAVATYRVRRANEAIEMSRRTDDRAAHAPAPAHAPLCSARARDGGVPSDQAWRQTIDLDVGLCILCNEIVDLSDGGGRCSLCTSLTCERCSDTPSTCELCCESFCNECRLVRRTHAARRAHPRPAPSRAALMRARLAHARARRALSACAQVATCVACMKDYCDDCQEVLMCHDCDAVLCPECHADHQCETGTQISSLQPPQSAPPPASSDPYTARRNVSASADGQKSHIAKSLTAWVPQQPAHVYKCVSPRNPGSGGGAGVTATITMQPVLSHSA